MAYSKTPVINLLKELSDGSNIILESNGSKTFTKTFKDGELLSNTLAVSVYSYIEGDSDKNFTSFRYRTDVYAELEIIYFKDDSTPAHKQVLYVYPSNYYERGKALPVTFRIPIDGQYIESIKFSVYNKTKSSLVITRCLIKKEVSAAEDYAEYTGISNTSLSKVEAFNNGCKIYYDDQENPTTLVFEGDSNGNLVSVLVNPNGSNQRRILFNRNNSNL